MTADTWQARPRALQRPFVRAAHGLIVLGAAMAFGLAGSGDANARITRIEVTATQSPTFGGYSWRDVGQYEKIVGVAYGEVDPADPKNAVIVDIGLAPRNANGRVEYSFDFYILKPIAPALSQRSMLYEPPNRGRKTWNTFGRIPAGNDPGGTITDQAVLANAFVLQRGMPVVWSGWDKSAGSSNAGFNMTVNVPVAKHPDGSSITGPSYEYIVTNASTYALSYPAATLDKSTARLTHRVRLDDTPVDIPAAGWSYNADGTAISLASGAFVNNDIYEFSYTAKDPTVNGLGLAAVRDWNAWLRYAAADDVGHRNPLAGLINRVYTEVVSQPGRLLNDFRYLGFNQSEDGRIVFDGLLQWIAAGNGLNLNYRFSQPGRTERNRQDHLYVEGVFPFANVVSSDPISGKTDSRLARCESTNTCPLAVEIYSANEYWVKTASLLHTTPDGLSDLPDSPFTRNYLISSHQHGVGSATTAGACQQLQNPLDSAPIQRALFVALDAWTRGTPPPASRVPKLVDGTLANPLPQSAMGFPRIPGVTYNGLKTTRYRFNHGPGFYDTGIASINPPVTVAPLQDNPANGPIYPSFIPRTDSDGNDIAGVRLADVTVPLATYTGWALRAGPQAGDGCEAAGQYIPFARTAADRAATGDPRPSVAERYASFAQYATAIRAALDGLVADRLMLCEDTGAEQTRLFRAGIAAGVPPPQRGMPVMTPLPHCGRSGAPMTRTH